MPTTPNPESDSEIPPEEIGPFVIAQRGGLFYNTLFPDRDTATRYVCRDYDYTEKALAQAGITVRPARWQERENLRFRPGGGYKEPVWKSEAFWVNRPLDVIEHYAHQSTEDSNLIAFTESAAKGERDIQTRMKAGRYLRRYFPDLSAKQVAFFAEWAQRGKRPPVDFGVLDLKFAKTPEEISEIYENGPESCMHAEDCVRVYGAGDLAIAYLEPRNTGEHAETGLPRYPARVLVWPEKKAMGRVYPTPDQWSGDGFSSESDAKAMQDQLFDRLKDDGYTSFYEDSQVFDGARLLAIPYNDDDDNTWVMPYIDNNRFEGDAKDGFFRLKQGGNWCAGDTGGYACGPWRNDNPRKDCARCGAQTFVEDMSDVGTDTPRGDGTCFCCQASWCPDCTDDRTFVCAGSGLTFDTYVPHITRRDGTTVTRTWAENHPQPTEEAPAVVNTPLPFPKRARDYRGRFIATPPPTSPRSPVLSARVNVFTADGGSLFTEDFF